MGVNGHNSIFAGTDLLGIDRAVPGIFTGWLISVSINNQTKFGNRTAVLEVLDVTGSELNITCSRGSLAENKTCTRRIEIRGKSLAL